MHVARAEVDRLARLEPDVVEQQGEHDADVARESPGRERDRTAHARPTRGQVRRGGRDRRDERLGLVSVEHVR